MVRTLHTFPLFLASAWIISMPGPAMGQNIPSPYHYIEAGQEAGFFFGRLRPSTGRFDLGPKAGKAYGIRYSVELGGPFSLEGVGRVFSSTRDVRDPTRPAGDRTVGEADVRLGSVDARLKFSLTGRRTWHGFSPFLMTGGGVVWDMSGGSPVDERILPDDRFTFGTSFMGLLGAGVRWIPFQHLEFRADSGFSLWRLRTPSGYLNSSRDLGFTSPPPQKEWVSALGETLGFALRW